MLFVKRFSKVNLFSHFVYNSLKTTVGQSGVATTTFLQNYCNIEDDWANISQPKLDRRTLGKKSKELTQVNPIVIIDGTPLALKAFNGSKPQQLDKNSPKYIKMIFVFTKQLLKIRKSFEEGGANISHMSIFFDSITGNTKKQQIDPNYRKNLFPDEFIKYSKNTLIKVAQSCSLEALESTGNEADEIMALVIQRSIKNNQKVTIVSNDRDVLQLISNSVNIYDPIKKEFYDEKYVKLKLGVNPNQISHLKAMTGDTKNNSQNIIGRKQATELLSKYGNIDNVVNNLIKIQKNNPNISVGKNSETETRIKLLKNLKTLSLNLKLQKLTQPIFNQNNSPPKNFDIFLLQKLDRQKILDFLHENPDWSRPLINTVKRDWMPPFPTIKSPFDIIDEKKEISYNLGKNGIENTTIVKTKDEAERVVKILRNLTERYHAVDCETMGTDITKESIFSKNTNVFAFSVFCGDDVDFGNGPRLFVDNLDENEGNLEIFKQYFEDKNIKKIFHNYSFDKAVLRNHGINVQGFSADTMHMGRLWDSSRLSYSLESLSAIFLQDSRIKESIFKKDQFMTTKKKYKMKYTTKNGQQKFQEFDSPEELHRNSDTFEGWVDYTVTDTEVTWHLRNILETELKKFKWEENKTLFNFYENFWSPLGELLTEMEKTGIFLDLDHLQKIEKEAQIEGKLYESKFRDWATTVCNDSELINIGSEKQIQQLFFAPCPNKKDKTKKLEKTKQFVVKENGQNKTISITGLGLPCGGYTATGWPSANVDALRKVAGFPKEGKFGRIETHYLSKNDEISGKNCSLAIDNLLEVNSISTLLSNFIKPLQSLRDDTGNIHTQININTATGRLSSKKPNLQNQPSFDKDKFKIRSAFQASKGNQLIVADYNQIELRILAHVTKCKSMIEAFHQGGDFHSRTALDLYPNIKKDFEEKKVLIEKLDSEFSDIPTIKEKFGFERKRAKTVNFSIAYGKTARGFADEWGVSVREAEHIVSKWYKDRPEVLNWQRKVVDDAIETGYTKTLLGRLRRLPELFHEKYVFRAHAERAAINTPIQGGAADVVNGAMVKLFLNEELSKMGWKQVLQVHDEIVFEGPEESVEEATNIISKIMTNPLDKELSVPLLIDIKNGKDWWSAK